MLLAEMNFLKNNILGIILCILIGAAGWLAGKSIPLGGTTLAIIIGIIIGNLFKPGDRFKSGIAFSEKKILLIAFLPIVLDGFTQTVFALRESNNLLRLLTGFIFTLGVFAFITQRFLKPRFPEFRERMLDSKLLVINLIIIAFIFSAVSVMLEPFGEKLMSKNQAEVMALESSPFFGESNTYYVPPNTPLTNSCPVPNAVLGGMRTQSSEYSAAKPSRSPELSASVNRWVKAPSSALWSAACGAQAVAASVMTSAIAARVTVEETTFLS